jgi:hypothetical protein
MYSKYILMGKLMWRSVDKHKTFPNFYCFTKEYSEMK